MKKDAIIYVAGHKGMVGSAITRALKQQGFLNIVTRTSKELDLRNQKNVADFFSKVRPEYVFIAAAKVGGIYANSTYPAEFIYDNLQIASNLIHFSFINGVKKILYPASSCIYPKMATQPIKEEYLLTGPLETTNEPYAIAKIAGIKMCDVYREQYNCNFISVMPTNLYGYNDNYHAQNSHVLPAMIRRFHEAKVNKLPSVVIWGTGSPRREFLFADDMAAACLHLMQHYNKPGPINIGTGEDISIEELAYQVKRIVGYKGTIVFDSTKPDGTLRKVLDVSKIHSMGWQHSTLLADGIKLAYQDFLKRGIYMLEPDAVN